MTTAAREEIPPLFQGLFDDAALFPPGNAPTPNAVRLHGEHRRSAHAGLVGGFVCPSGRLSELDAAARENDLGTRAVSLTVPGGVDELARAVRSVGAYPGLRLAAIEVPVPAGELPAALRELSTVAGAEGCAVFVEVPVRDVTASISDQLAESGLCLKVRTGGTVAEAFPDEAMLAAAIGTAVRSRVRFKCTAGLHNAIRHVDPATGFAHHGFLNVLLSVHAAQIGSAVAGDLLAARDPAELARQVRALSPEAAETLRAQFRSIGSCSITEPLNDLRTLGLVSAA